jgi:hypothetical protein
MAEMKETRLATDLVKPGDLQGLVNWLDMPKNHNDAANAIAVVPDPKRDKAFVDFLASSPAFQGWEYNQIAQAIEKANEMNLMEKKMKKSDLKKMVSEAVKSGIQKAKESQKKLTKEAVAPTKITKTAIAEAVRKAVRTSLKEAGMPGGAMPPAGKPSGTQMTAPTQEEGVSDGDPKRGSSTFGELPSAEELQAAIDALGGWDMTLRGSDERIFNAAMKRSKINPANAVQIMNTGEGMRRVLQALLRTGREEADSLASSIMDVLGWEWI